MLRWSSKVHVKPLVILIIVSNNTLMLNDCALSEDIGHTTVLKPSGQAYTCTMIPTIQMQHHNILWYSAIFSIRAEYFHVNEATPSSPRLMVAI